MREVLAGAVMLTVLSVATPVHAHPLSPALLELRELGGHAFEVTWRQPAMKLPGTADKRPILPERCAAATPARVVEDGSAITAVWSIECGPRGLVGERIGVEGLAEARTDALVRIRLFDGQTVRGVISGNNPFFVVPARDGRMAVARSYSLLGIEHILAGVDHLLFVLGLMLLVRSTRGLVGTITAFTLGHSVTLSMVALGLATVPTGPAEVLIALSIYVLAVELARGGAAGKTVLGRYPWAIAVLFGLLHGMGFAGALREIGLPEHEIPLSLLSFNVGIEAGQLAFVFVVLAVRHGLQPVLAVLPGWAGRVPAYALGSLAAFWVVERSALLL